MLYEDIEEAGTLRRQRKIVAAILRDLATRTETVTLLIRDDQDAEMVTSVNVELTSEQEALVVALLESEQAKVDADLARLGVELP